LFNQAGADHERVGFSLSGSIGGGMSDQVKPCPFCGSSDINFDTINGRNGFVHVVRMKCQNCGAGTAWYNGAHQAVAAWNVRDDQALKETWDKRFNPPKDRIVNGDLFTLNDATYARNPETGNCFVHPWKNHEKAKRVSRKVFMEMYQLCEKKIAEKNKAHGGKHGAA
jgi:Lar family restriction alleviation protein